MQLLSANSILKIFIQKCDKFSTFSAMGALSAFAFAPFNLFFCFLISFAWLFIQICEHDSFKKFFKFSFVFFLFFHIFGLFWLVHPLTINISQHWVLIPFAVTVIPAYFSLQLSLSLYFSFYKFDIFQKFFISSISLSLIIYFYSNYCPGFAWLIPGYIWASSIFLIQPFSIFGIYGYSLITIIVAFAIGASILCFMKKNSNFKIFKNCSILILFFIIIFSIFRVLRNDLEFTNVKVRIVQCNLDQKNKMDKSRAYKNFFQHLFLSKGNSKCDFIIWPEVSFPHIYRVGSQKFVHFFENALEKDEVLLFGAVRKSIEGKFFNSIIAINHEALDLGYYDKCKLVPFGEYIPLRKFIPFKSIASEIGDFDRGEKGKILNIKGVRFLPAICYEAVFPDNFVSYTSNADVILNITNDAWFGYTSEPFQHLEIVKCRAVEFGLPLIRVTNFGISAIFDPLARRVASIDINRSGFVDFYMPKKLHSTLYAEFGDIIFFFMIFLLVFLFFSYKKFFNRY